MHSEVYFWHERMKWVSFSTVFWQDVVKSFFFIKRFLIKITCS